MQLNVSLQQPSDSALVLIDQRTGLAFGVGSEERQILLNNTVALAHHEGLRQHICETSFIRREVARSGLAHR
jgi:hypothetical protein